MRDFLNEKFSFNCFLGTRNDIRVIHNRKEYKISGTAFKISGKRAYCHGTLLVNSNLLQLKQSLSPSNICQRITESKSIPSVSSSVVNLSSFSNINHDIIEKSAITYFNPHTFINLINIPEEFEHEKYKKEKKCNNSNIHEVFNYKEYPENMIDKVHSTEKRFSSNEWIFGKTPKFLLDGKLVDFSNRITTEFENFRIHEKHQN